MSYKICSSFGMPRGSTVSSRLGIYQCSVNLFHGSELHLKHNHGRDVDTDWKMAVRRDLDEGGSTLDSPC